MTFNFKQFEKDAQEKWQKADAFRFDNNSDRRENDRNQYYERLNRFERLERQIM